LNASWGFWRTFFKPDSCFWMAFMFQGWLSISWRWRTFRATKLQQNDRKCWKNSRTHPWRPSLNNPWADTAGISYGVCQEILTENMNMHHTAPSSQQHARPHVPENHRVCD
jgi:hypothetical protein